MAGPFQSSINLNIGSTPDLQDLGNPGKMAMKLVEIYNALKILQQAIDTYTGNTPTSPTDWSATDPGAVSTLAHSSKFYLIAGEALSAGLLVAFDVNGHAVYADKASSKQAIGIVTSAVAMGAVAEIILLGCLNIYATGTFTKGTLYYLGDAGHLVATIPTTVGDMIQPVAWAYLDTAIYLNPSMYTETVPAPPPGP